MNSTVPVWAAWLQALSVPAGVLVAIILGILNYRLSYRSRRQEIASKIKDVLVELHKKHSRKRDGFALSETEVNLLCVEIGFLFGNEAALLAKNHLQSEEGDYVSLRAVTAAMEARSEEAIRKFL